MASRCNRLLADPRHRRLSRFFVVGALAAGLQTLLLWAFVDVAGIYYLLASIVAIEITIVTQYFFNNAWTFQNRSHESRESLLGGLVRTNLVRGSAIPLQTGLLFLFVQFGGLAYLVANAVAILVSGVYRYVLDAHWTWG
jgi:putative flippase GtrA